MQLIQTETLHLAEAQVQDLIGTPLEARFNRLARMTRRALGVRAATISFINREGEWFKATTGWNVSELPPERSLVSALLGDNGSLAIADMLKDERSCRHPLVTGSPKFRFCAMQAIYDRFGGVIGAVAAYDTGPHRVTADVMEAIADAGALAQRELQLSDFGDIQQKLMAKLDASRRQAMIDELTRLWNRRAGMMLLEQALAEGRRNSSIGVCVADVDDFKGVNDKFGHAMGDVVLRKLAAALVDSLRPGDIACRLGGDEFLLLIPDIPAEQLEPIIERVRNRVKSLVIRTRAGDVKVTVSLGGTVASLDGGAKAEELVTRADEAMYEVKRRRDTRWREADPNPDF